MPWVEAMLRGQKVLAKVKGDGTFAVEGGRVEIRYQPKGGKAYRANASNLVRPSDAKLLPDDACGAAEPGPASPSGEVEAPAPQGSRERWIAYADGACSGNPGPAGSGFVVVAPDGKMREAYEYLGEATNNVAELTAVLRALEMIPDSPLPAVIHTDSKYTIGVLTQGWKAKKNPELVARVKGAIQARKGSVRLVYVPGHSGVPLNERADELAREAIRTRSSTK
jgi:ribonuclease HI